MLPLECEALTRGAAAQPSGSKLPRHVSHGPGIFVGKIRELRRGSAYFAFRRVFALLPLSFDGYSPDVAANSAIGPRNPLNSRRTAPIKLQALFVFAMMFYGGCAWDTLGCAGCLDSRFLAHVRPPPESRKGWRRFLKSRSETMRNVIPSYFHADRTKPQLRANDLPFFGGRP